MNEDFQLAWHYGTDWPEWGSAPRRPLVEFSMAHKGEWLDSVVGMDPATGTSRVYHVVRCELCLVIHLFPLTPPSVLAAYYQQQFYQQTKPQYLAEYAEDAHWWRLVHGTVLDRVAHLASPLPGMGMLDIGAGPGLALAVGRTRGYDTYALEPSPLAAAALREAGHAVVEGTLNDAPACYPLGGFDVLYAWEVLEHQPNPDDFLMQCADLLRPGGVLVVAVPNDYSPAQLTACQRFGLPPWWVAPPDHQCYWTPKTLQLALRRCGFRVAFTRMTYPLVERFMLEDGINYVGHPALGRRCHQDRMAWELWHLDGHGCWADLEAEYIANVATRTGREIVMLGQKE